MHYCSSHAETETSDACHDCGRPFCDACLVELSGRRLCGWCRDARVATAQRGSAIDPTLVVLLARIFNGLNIAIAIPVGLIMSGLAVFGGMRGDADPDSIISVIFYGVTGVGSILLSLAVLLPPTIKLGPRQPLMWEWQLAAVITSIVGSCCGISCFGCLTILPAVVLLFYWLRPEVQQYVKEAPAE